MELQRENTEIREKNFQATAVDGILVGVIKFIFHHHIWQFGYKVATKYLSIPLALKLIAWKKKKYENCDEFRALRIADDIYMILWLILLSVCYVVAFRLPVDFPLSYCRYSLFPFDDLISIPLGTYTLCLLLIFFAFYRIMETLSVVVMLHINGHYRTEAPMRAALKTLIAYAEMAVAYAILYMVLGYMTDDCILISKLQTCLDPYYFSVMTMATVGYGDLAPTTEWTKTVAICQTFTGITLIVIAIQRAMGAKQE